MSAMGDDERRPIEIWVEDDEDFGAGDGAISKQGTAWDLDDQGNKGGTEVGNVERIDHPASRDAAAVTVLIRLNGAVFPRGTVVAKGALPYDREKGDIVGTGLLAITNGTGGHTGISGVFEVETLNPKKYRQL